MSSGDQISEWTHVGATRRRLRLVISAAMWVVGSALGLLLALVVLGVGGYSIPFWPSDTEMTDQKPYSDFVGREYRVVGPVAALAWNDFPDKTKILVVSLTSPPGAHNRFVSYKVPLQRGQEVRILSAWRSLSLFHFSYYYLVSVPGVKLPEGVPIKMDVSPEGIPDPSAYEDMQSNKALHSDGSRAARENRR
jgi:hypothetical protein